MSQLPAKEILTEAENRFSDHDIEYKVFASYGRVRTISK